MWGKVCMYGGMGGSAVCGMLARLSYKNYNRGRLPTKTLYRYSEPATREDMIKRMKNEVFDLLVIGGGATGSGVVLDAATRGLKCALVEREDFGSGTSSRSTKLIHGGIRYLQSALLKLDIAQFKLLCEALTERAHLMAAAPYMARPVPILMPVFKLREVPMFWFGVKLYDWIGKMLSYGKPGLPNCFWVSRSNSSFFFPLLKRRGLKGSIMYYDGQMNDARLNLQIALTSTIPQYIPGMQAAAVANHCTVTDLSASDNKLSTVDVKDNLSGETFTVKTRAIVNCTGPFADTIRQTGTSTAVRNLIRASSGVHVTLPSYYSSSPFGMIIPETTDGRVLYYLPWENNTIAGTTDQPAKPVTLPEATKREVDFVVKESCRYLTVDDSDLRKDIRSTWSGLRPLVTNPKSPEGATQQLSRTHEIVVERNGVISVLGGKWTTYRRMAQDALDKIIEVHGAKFEKLKKPRTKFMMLSNAVNTNTGVDSSLLENDFSSGRLPVTLVHDYGLSIDQARHLVSNYGYRAIDLCKMGKEMDLLQPLVNGHPFVRAEVVYGVRHEMARTPSDVIGRRLRLAFVDAEAALSVLDEVTHVMGRELAWNASTFEKMRKTGLDYVLSMQGGM